MTRTPPVLATLTRPDAEALVADAVRAPSLHNSQPWRFHVHARSAGAVIDVYADTHRAAPVIDPSGRALRLSVGAALLGLRLAIAVRRGQAPLVRLLPDPHDPTHVATVRLGGPYDATPAERALHAAIPRRRTSREPFADRRLAPVDLERLETAARIEGAGLRLLDEDMVRWVLQLTGEAERQWAADPAYREELRRWTTLDPADGEGVPSFAFGPRDHTGRLHARDFGAGHPQRGRAVAAFETSPQLALLVTSHDTVSDHLRAGQALHRVLLTATDAGLGVGLMHQAVEMPDLRRLLRHPASGPAAGQIVLRLGYPAAPPPPGTVPRRPVQEVLDYTAE